MNKSVITNLLALLLVVIGFLMSGEQRGLVLNTGLFALSGGLTNWLAVYMLFEKVPGFYGSGVIPERFEEFKHGIKKLVMEQFFNAENLENFFKRMSPDEKEGQKEEQKKASSTVQGLIDAVDFNAAFEGLVEVIMNSSFGSMLTMVGGAKALEPLQQPFVKKMQEFMLNVSNDAAAMARFKQVSSEASLSRIEDIVDHRLQELTPQLVKEIVQQMIQKHLGWLVVWGGVLGGVIGLLVSVLLT